MKRILFLIFIPFLITAQSFKRTLLKANSFYFKNHVYVFGYLQIKNEIDFKLYKISNTLNSVDSVSFLLGREKLDSYLEITSDTMHNFLNFYFQKSDSKNKASLIRLNDSLKLIARAENFDANKINSLTSFEDDKFWFKNSCYTIRSSMDSAGKQYFLNRYSVTNFQKPFEYQSMWQFPFEKRNISTAHVFYADTSLVMIYVNVLAGAKSGTWVLKINNKTGQLITGSKLNHKGDTRHFLPTAFSYNKKTKQLLAAGNIYSEQQLSFGTGAHSFLNLDKQNTFFFITVDSIGDVISRNEKNYPIILLANKTNLKQVFYYHLKIKELQSTSGNDFKAYCSIYKSTGQELLFLYTTGFCFNFGVNEIGLEILFDKLLDNLSSLPNLITNDAKDINGKMEISSINEFDKFLFKWPLTDVEKFFGTYDLNNPKWILNKSDINTGNNSFYLVRMGKKGLENKIILESSKYNHPAIYKLSNEKLLLFNFDATLSVFEIYSAIW